MKFQKTILLNTLFLLSLTVSAQDLEVSAPKTETLPKQKSFMFEVNFNPFGSEIISLEHIQAKYWLTDNVVLRLGLNYDKNSINLKAEDYDANEEHKVTGSEQATKFGVFPGIEYRFFKNSRISPYLALQFNYERNTVNANYRDYIQEYDNNLGQYIYTPVEITVDGGKRTITYDYIQTQYGGYYYQTINYANEKSYSQYGGNLLAGFDFFVWKNLYLGVEAGVNYSILKYDKVLITSSNKVEKNTFPSLTIQKTGLYYNSAFRLGFWF